MMESIVWAVLNIYFEARGEPFEGQKLIAHVMLNRAKQRNISLKEVVRQRDQFSWYNDRKVDPITEPLALVSCAKALMAAWIKQQAGYRSRGINHYHSVKMEKWPYWSESMEPEYIVGDHIFYANR
jgi:spore germination cell wall hydrolase CwlJ-like protein